MAGGDPPAIWTADNDVLNAEKRLDRPRPVVGGQHDSTVNVTSLAVFADCPRKYYLQRYIGWNGRTFTPFDPEDLPEPVDATDLTAADLGSAVHEILAGKSGSWPAEAEELANVFLTSDLGARAASSARAEREWDFIVDVEGTLVRGTVDLWFEENGEIVVVDYKTDNVKSVERAQRLTRHNSRSTGWPSSALSESAPSKPGSISCAQMQWWKFRWTTPPFAKLRICSPHRAAQNTLRFDLREGDHCRVCQYYRSLCPAGLKGPESN